MSWVGFLFNTTWNIHLHYSKHVINIFLFFLFLTVIFNLNLLFFSLKHPIFTLDGSQVLVRNHGSSLPLSKISVLLIIPNITWYKLNQHTNTTTCSFPLATISLVMCLSYSSESSISNSSSRTGDVFWPILADLSPASCPLCYLWSDYVPAPELFYNVVSIFTQDKPHIICIILRLIICPACNFAM